MSQNLILPVNKTKLTASWKTDAYKMRFGFTHYGIDMVSSAGDRSLYASGSGTVAAAGKDNAVGNVVAVIYPDAQNHLTGKTGDIVFRYFHLNEIKVKAGDKVTKDTLLGIYGNTGMLEMPAHLHLEADTDTANPLYTPTVRSSNLIKGTAAGASDKTMTNPLEWLYCKPGAPDNQSYTTTCDIYIRTGDKTIPNVSEQNNTSELDTLLEENDKLRQNNGELSLRISMLRGSLSK